MSSARVVDPRVLVVAGVGLLGGSGVANHCAGPFSQPVLVNARHRHVDAYGIPSEPYCYQVPVGGNVSQPYSPSYYISTMYPEGVSDELRLLRQLEEWIGPSLTGSLFPLPLMHKWGAGITAIELNADQHNRMGNIYNVIEHVYTAAGYDRGRTADALTRISAFGGETALGHLQADRYEDAYLAAIQTLRLPRDKGLVTGRGTRRALDATVAFLDED